MAKKTKDQLFEETTQAWTVVVAVHGKDAGKELIGTMNTNGTHKLCHKRGVVARGKGQAELSRFQHLAELYNRKGIEPLPKYGCAADHTNPEKYLKDIS
jgi:hypothetical protein